MAFAFQLLLTNLGVALGLSALGWAISPSAGTTTVERNREGDDRDTTEAADESKESGVPPVNHLLGAGVTLTLATVLFVTAFLATTFSGIFQLLPGVIFGLILWAAYLLIIIWVSSVTVSGILDFVLGTATEGIRRLFLGVSQLFSSDASKGTPKAFEKDLLSQVEALSSEVKQALSDQKALPVLLTQQREALLKEICDRTSLDLDQAESVLDSLGPESELSGTEAAKATNITTGDISAEVSTTEGSGNKRSEPAAMLAQMIPDWRDLLRMAVSQIDTSDLDIETAWNMFQRFVGEEEAVPFNIVALDAENYLREAPIYSLQAETLSEEFTERIYDLEANPSAVAQQVQVLDRADFEQWLRSRGDLAEETIEGLANKLSAVREEVLTQAEKGAKQLLAERELANREPAEQELAIEVLPDAAQVLSDEEKATADEVITAIEEKLTAYFRYTSLSKLSAQSVADKLRALGEEIEDFGQKIGRWIGSGVVLDFEAIAQTLSRRKGIQKKKQEELVDALKSTWNSYQLKPAAVSLSQKMTNYLQEIDWSEANLEELKGEILRQIEIGISMPGGFAESLDVGKLVTSLKVPESVKTDLFSLIQKEGRPLLKRPRRWVERAANKSQYWGTRLARQVGQYVANQGFSAEEISSGAEKIVQETHQILQSAAQSIPAEQIPHLGAEFWQQVLDQLPDADSAQAESATESAIDRLTTTWQSTTQALPEVKDRLKQQSVTRLQDIQTAARSLARFVGDDVLEPVLEAIPELGDLDNLLAPTRQKFVAAIDLAQDSFAQQTAAMAQDLQQQAEHVRRQVAIAAWWLFVSLFASGTAAAAGGWLAVWLRLQV